MVTLWWLFCWNTPSGTSNIKGRLHYANTYFHKVIIGHTRYVIFISILKWCKVFRFQTHSQILYDQKIVYCKNLFLDCYRNQINLAWNIFNVIQKRNLAMIDNWLLDKMYLISYWNVLSSWVSKTEMITVIVFLH